MVSGTYEDLRGKIAIVTGANGGMGLAISSALADAGVKVVASDVQDTPVPAQRDGVEYSCADVTEESDIEALTNFAMQNHGRLDCAINAAAIEFETNRLAECDIEDFDRILSVNLRGVFLCMKYQLRAMLKGGGGVIVNLASTTSFQAGNIQPAYTASKHGVVGLTRQAAIDYARDGVRVNAIAPGNIDTPMLRDAIARRGIDSEAAASRMPFGRFGQSEEVAAAALWLCSNASSFTTGHVITVESGMLLT